jgi:VanZ family protein
MNNFFFVILSILAVLIATLYPFNFFLIDNFSIHTFIASFDNASSFQDVVNNILLFMPLGFSSTAFFQKIKIKTISKLFILVLISSGLSLTVEILQIFLPSRSPTPADLINNTIGGIVGIICFYIWHSPSFIYILSSLENSNIRNSVKRITLLFFGYILLSFLISIPWQNTISLSNWHLNYSLLLGNERTGNKPWHGYISEFHIADKAISAKDVSELFDNKNYLKTIGDYLIGSYQLTNKLSYQDATGKLPELLSQGQSPKIQNEKGVVLSSSHWLKTKIPATLLSERIRKTSQFTIITTVATADTTQTGPGRIISLSSNTLHRNFTLGQQGKDLDLRVRTPITGENGTGIKLSIPGVFATNDFHSLIITYSPGTLKVYVDKVQNLSSFNLLELIPKYQRTFYYALTFIPLGICLTFLTILAKGKLSFYKFLLSGGIILPALIVETILVMNTGKSIDIANILLGIFFTGITMLLLRLRAAFLVKKAVME